MEGRLCSEATTLEASHSRKNTLKESISPHCARRGDDHTMCAVTRRRDVSSTETQGFLRLFPSLMNEPCWAGSAYRRSDIREPLHTLRSQPASGRILLSVECSGVACFIAKLAAQRGAKQQVPVALSCNGLVGFLSGFLDASVSWTTLQRQ